MANASTKRIAAANVKLLKALPKNFYMINVLAILVRIMKWKVYGRQLLPSGFVGFLHGLGFVASMFIWRWFVEIGTPTRNAKGDLRVPADLGSSGVVEMAWDVIHITWICTLGGALLGNWVWWLTALIPCFAAWKLFGVAKPFLGMFLPGMFGPKAPKEEAAPAVVGGAQPGESRKQAKLRARAEKGDRRVQSVRR
ncbi:hypothetical protein CspeluHIS016_0106500 [Cutaneotrichosporon spelunceum]|uniref:DUF788-domain-containing protein n=1 Tax=Cutaneotrichosporon spelunceum TaxID=1672016 RepID=A0AAD3TP63_9TREE|nr:hypothetical protein CspeluHIS016_0106500 [Cutaneotrichosporon spelunceum]